jgi:hypothetical protein
MNDSVTIKKGFGTRMKDSFSGIIGGFIFILIGIGVLIWNERNNVINIRDTKELRDVYVDVKSDKVDKDNEGKLIATSGKLDYNNEILRDETFNISISTPYLRRTVEVYQWEEEKTDSEGETTYSYKKVWTDELIDSSKFNTSGSHSNPSSKPYENDSMYASELKVGAYKLSSSFTTYLEAKSEYTDLSAANIPEGYTFKNGYITNSEDLEKPSVGDVRISFQYANYNDVSVMGKLNNETVTEYTTKKGSKFSYFVDGTHDGEYMISAKEKGDKMFKWILRAIGTLAIILGIAALFGPINTLTSYVPILGNLVSGATGIIAFLLGLALSLIVIAISWIVFRPLLGICLLVAAIALIVIVKKCFSKKEPAGQTTEQKE